MIIKGKTGNSDSILFRTLQGLIIGSLCIMISFQRVAAQNELDPKIEKAIDKLLEKMTVAEKAGQMTQITLDVISKTNEAGEVIKPRETDPEKLKEALLEYHVGSILNVTSYTLTPEHWQTVMDEVQKVATKDSRMKIPIIYGVDAIHGVNYTVGGTLFPQQLGQAAGWDPSLVEKAAAVTAYETRASGIPWNFSPVLDLGRQPMWSRFFETYGEDVHLASEMSEAVVRGYQGEDPSDKTRVAACLKHYVGYSMPRSGKDRTPAFIPERQLREYFLPTFQRAIDEGAQTIMINSGAVNGIPGHANHYLLTEVLRNELGFTGFTVSDWEDLIMLHSVHRVAPTLKEAVRIGINAGVDMSMVPQAPYKDFHRYVVELVEEGKISRERLDEAVRRILRVKFRVGLFDKTHYPLKDYPEFGSQKSADLAREIAASSITLLKNEGNILPLSTDTDILVSGPSAHSLNALNGAWTHTWQGVETEYNTPGKPTIYEALGKAIKGQVNFVKGADFEETTDIAAAVKAAENAEVILVCLGEMPSTEKPGDRHSMLLPDAQIELVKALKKTGKPMVLVLVEGRPLIIHEIVDDFDAILQAYLPGDEGARALTDILTGKVNPSGKLPYTYPRYEGDLVFYDHNYSEMRDRYFGWEAFDPLYEFGFGLSYTKFAYSDLRISDPEMGPDGSVTISVQVRNTGDREGKEVVQLFISDLYAEIAPAVKRLRGFQKISLKPGESREVSFTVSGRDLAFVGLENHWKTEAGEFEVQVADQKQKFRVTAGKDWK